MNQTVYYLPEHLNACLEHLATNSYHLFVNGQWTYSFRAPAALMQSYREFVSQGYTCTVVTGGEIVFYGLRKVKAGDWVTAGGSDVIGCVKRVARNGSWCDVDWHTHTKRMQTRVLSIQHTITAGEWEITDVTRRGELEREAWS